MYLPERRIHYEPEQRIGGNPATCHQHDRPRHHSSQLMEAGWPRVRDVVSNLRLGAARSGIWREDHSREACAAGDAVCRIYRLDYLTGWVQFKQVYKHNHGNTGGNLSAHHHVDLRLGQPNVPNRVGGELAESNDDSP